MGRAARLPPRARYIHRPTAKARYTPDGRSEDQVKIKREKLLVLAALSTISRLRRIMALSPSTRSLMRTSASIFFLSWISIGRFLLVVSQVEAAVLPRQAFTSSYDGMDTQSQQPSTMTLYVEATSTIYPSYYNTESNSISASNGGVAYPSSSSSSPSTAGGGAISSNNNGNAPLPVLMSGQNPSNPASWTVYNADQV